MNIDILIVTYAQLEVINPEVNFQIVYKTITHTILQANFDTLIRISLCGQGHRYNPLNSTKKKKKNEQGDEQSLQENCY